jgi:hypothetical protein
MLCKPDNNIQCLWLQKLPFKRGLQSPDCKRKVKIYIVTPFKIKAKNVFLTLKDHYMTFLEALYGSQYVEIAKAGKDGNKGRLNGNIFLTAFVILCLLTLASLYYIFTKQMGASPGLSSTGLSGKAIGKLIAIPLFALIYFVITKTVGSESNFRDYVERFLKHPEAERKKANGKLLIPFFVVLGLFILCLFLG